jgi:hypothetical protein
VNDLLYQTSMSATCKPPMHANKPVSIMSVHIHVDAISALSQMMTEEPVEVSRKTSV